MLPIPDVLRTAAHHAIGLPGRLVPYAAQKPVLHIALNRAFKEPLETGELEFLDGSLIRIRITDANVDWLIEAAAQGFVPVDRDREEDVCISGELLDFTLLATRQVDHDTLFFQRRIRIEGDTELGLGLKNTMDSMDWDDLPPPLRMFLRGLGMVIEKLSFLKPAAI
ncbi:MAG: SCP2 sterol-binding domain-containing protein [Xanthomonadales bacterium]|jgi:predicted lipid carrier protein YhbT|nr:SCP2 sterol-binding domain-containing protein [Xanthomonadales bacterium]